MSKKRKLVWTRELRDLLWSRFFERFGARETWGGRRQPHNQELSSFYEDMSVAFSKLTGREFTMGSISNQIAWGLSLQPNVESTGCVYNWVQNVSAALNAGVLGCRDLPSLLLVERSLSLAVA